MITDILPKELIHTILNFNKFNVSYRCELRLVCKDFYNNISFMSIKIYKFNRKIFNITNDFTITPDYGMSKRTSDYFKNINDIRFCVNNNCTSYNNSYYRDHLHNDRKCMMKVVYFYYPKNLVEDEYDAYGANYIHCLRLRQCMSAHYIKRFIPYCQKCMHKFCYIEKRPNGQIIPYGNQYLLYN